MCNFRFQHHVFSVQRLTKKFLKNKKSKKINTVYIAVLHIKLLFLINKNSILKYDALRFCQLERISKGFHKDFHNTNCIQHFHTTMKPQKFKTATFLIESQLDGLHRGLNSMMKIGFTKSVKNWQINCHDNQDNQENSRPSDIVKS